MTRPLKPVEVVRDDLLLARRFLLRDLDRLERARHRVGDPFRAVGRAVESEHAVNDVDVREEVRDGARVRLALDAVEHQWGAAVEVLLQARDLKVWVNLDIRF